MDRLQRKEYEETKQHYLEIIPKVGLERIREVYRDALFMVVPSHRLAGLRDAIEQKEGE